MNHERWLQIDEVFRGALTRGPGARESFLQRVCAGDAALREEVESLLAHDRDASTTLDGTGGIVGRVAIAQVAEGDAVDAWRLGKEIGRGGSSVVFEARHARETLDRRVAIKVFNRTLDSDLALERFHTECRVLARLEHPDIARLYDAGITSEGLPYIVLERVVGVPLDDWGARLESTLDERLALFERICRAVAFAQQNLIIHRDLKPGNILVTADCSPKLLDFGIARLLPLEGPEDTRLTGPQGPPMTPQYASPEQLRGEDVSTATDVYSLGLVLYELLTARAPYRIDSLWTPTARDVASGVETITPPSGVLDNRGPIRNAAVRGDLDTIIARALAPEPAARYGTAQALGDDIGRFRHGLPIRARTPSAGYVAYRFVNRHRWASATAALLLLLILGFSYAMTVAAHRLSVARDRSAAEAATAEQVVSLMSGLFEGADPVVNGGRDVTARELLDRGAAAWDQAQDQPAATRAALALAIGKAYLDLSILPEARRYLERSLNLRGAQADPGERATNHALLSRLDLVEANFASAVEHAQTTVLFRDEEGEPVAAAEARVLRGRGWFSMGNLDAAEGDFQRALELLEGVHLDHPATVGSAMRELAGVRLARGQNDGAVALLVSALELLTKAHGTLHPEVFECRWLIVRFGDATEGPDPHRDRVSMLEALLSDQATLYGARHEQMVMTLIDLGSMRYQRGDDEESLEMYRQARRMQAELTGEDHVVSAIVLARIGRVLWALGERALATERFQTSLAIARRSTPPDSPSVASSLTDLGMALSEVGRCDEGLVLLREAAAILEKTRKPTDFSVLRARWATGYGLACSNDEDAGHSMMEESLQVVDTQGYGEEPSLRREVERWRNTMEGMGNERGR